VDRRYDCSSEDAVASRSLGRAFGYLVDVVLLLHSQTLAIELAAGEIGGAEDHTPFIKLDPI
jgi:hypothetical protein